ncbi:MAG: hypothetical protein MHM6MM_005107 [Cercozoa sp. M6MM]
MDVVSFDAETKLRLLDEAAVEHAQHLTDVTEKFVESTTAFEDVVEVAEQLFASQTEVVEKQRLRVIALRTQLNNEIFQRTLQEQQLKRQIAAEQKRLQRLRDERASVEAALSDFDLSMNNLIRGHG